MIIALSCKQMFIKHSRLLSDRALYLYLANHLSFIMKTGNVKWSL